VVPAVCRAGDRRRDRVDHLRRRTAGARGQALDRDDPRVRLLSVVVLRPAQHARPHLLDASVHGWLL
jgi:hypothetical protein